MNDFFDSWQFTYILVPILIAIAKIIDVSLGTLRIILISKGAKKLAPLLGFVEVLIWIVTIGQVMRNLTNPVNYFAYAFGFAIGNYVGILIDQKLALGSVLIRVITHRDASELITYLKNNDFGVTVIPAEGSMGHVHLIFTVIKRSNLNKVVEIIKDFNPNAFYSIEDIRYVSASYNSLETSRKTTSKSYFKLRK